MCMFMDIENKNYCDTDMRACWSSTEIWKKFEDTYMECNCKIVFCKELSDFLVQELQLCRKEKFKKLKEIEKDISEYLTCYSCFDLIYDPVTLSCGHSFCRCCLLKRENKSFVELCPKCDTNASKSRRWFFSEQNIVNNLCGDVTLSSIVQDCFSDTLESTKLRHEGNMLFQGGDHDGAENKYIEAVKISPDSFLCWSNLSNIRANRGYLNEALEFASKTIQISPLWSKGYYRQGVAYKKMKNYQESILSFLKYLILEPSSSKVKGMLYEDLGTYLSQLEANENDISSSLSKATTENGTSSMDIDVVNDKLENFDVKKFDAIKKLILPIIDNALEFCLCSYIARGRQRSPIVVEKFVEKMKAGLQCPLCHRIIFEPTTTPCGHTYCISCLERSLDYATACSICRRPLEDLISLKPKPINKIIDTLVKKYFTTEYEEQVEIVQSEKNVFLYDKDGVITVPIFVCGLGLPTLETSLHIFEPRYKLLVRRSLESNSKMFGMCMYNEEYGFTEYGTMLEIKQKKLLNDGRLLIDTCGGRRFQVVERSRKDGYNTAKVQWVLDDPIKVDEREDLIHACKLLYEECQDWFKRLSRMFVYRIGLEFGHLPDYNDNEIDDLYGPKWVWWMLRLFTQGNQDVATDALKSTNLNQRLNIVRSKLQFFQTISAGT